MSEEKKTETKEQKTDEKTDLVNVNVALVLAENEDLKRQLDAQKGLVVELTKKLSQATDLIEQDSKARLIADIAPKTNMHPELLSKMDVEKLTQFKKTLDTAVLPAFKSTAPLPSAKDRKPTLDNVFSDYMASLKVK